MGKNRTFKQKMENAQKRYHKNKHLPLDVNVPKTKEEIRRIHGVMAMVDKQLTQEQNLINQLGVCPKCHVMLTVKGECPFGCGYIKPSKAGRQREVVRCGK